MQTETQFSAVFVSDMFHAKGEFIDPSDLLTDISEAQASEHFEGSPYTIAEQLSHMRYWQRHSLDQARALKPMYPEHEADGWPPVLRGEWDNLRKLFLDELEECCALASDENVSRKLVGENTTAAAVLASCAMHNAYHFGQITLLRRLIGAWPPASGDRTW